MRLTSALGIALLASSALGCEPPPSAEPPDRPARTLEYIVGRARGSVPFDAVQCTRDARGALRVALEATRPLPTPISRDHHPRVLIATIHDEQTSPDVEASALLPTLRIEGEENGPAALIAQHAQHGSRPSSCDLTREEGEIELRCRGAAVRPWDFVGPPPLASFRARFSCPDAPP